MENIKEFYILCQPIDINIGNHVYQLNFIKVKDYLKLIKYNPLIFMKKEEILETINQNHKPFFEQLTYLEIIKYFDQDDQLNLYQNFKDLFVLCFDEDIFDQLINDEQLYYILDLIKKINCLKYEKPCKNPELEKFNIFKKVFQKSKGEQIDFESIYSSVWLYCGNKPDDLYIYELYALFYRLSQFKLNNITTLYSTVSSDVKVESWCKSIDILGIEEKKMTLKEFESKSKGVFSNQ